jgi:hypothetical protein
MATIYGGGKRVMENAKRQKAGKRDELGTEDTAKVVAKSKAPAKVAVKKSKKTK